MSYNNNHFSLDWLPIEDITIESLSDIEKKHHEVLLKKYEISRNLLQQEGNSDTDEYREVLLTLNCLESGFFPDLQEEFSISSETIPEDEIEEISHDLGGKGEIIIGVYWFNGFMEHWFVIHNNICHEWTCGEKNSSLIRHVDSTIYLNSKRNYKMKLHKIKCGLNSIDIEFWSNEYSDQLNNTYHFLKSNCQMYAMNLVSKLGVSENELGLFGKRQTLKNFSGKIISATSKPVDHSVIIPAK